MTQNPKSSGRAATDRSIPAIPSYSGRTLILYIGLFIGLMLIALGCACRAQQANQPAVRRYELKGRVESLDFDHKRVTVAHQEIKGYMDAMTMSFAVRDENALRVLKSGDQVQAILVYDSSTNLSWLEDIRVVQ
jgi:Cu/Ag efflux protein CusF